MGAAVVRRLGGLAVAGVLLWTAAPGKAPQHVCVPAGGTAQSGHVSHVCGAGHAPGQATGRDLPRKRP